MDHAAYHNELAEDAFPTPKTSKAQLRPWLHRHHPGEYREDMLKPKLDQQCKQLCPAPPVRLDLIAQAAGHTMVRTPPYHPELQPIEMCWAILKAYCASRCDYTLAGLKTHVEAGFDQVTPAVCQSLIQKMNPENAVGVNHDLLPEGYYPSMGFLGGIPGRAHITCCSGEPA